MATKKIVILASGSGSNFEAIVKGCRELPELDAEVVLLVAHREQSYCMVRAKTLGVPVKFIPFEKEDYSNLLKREAFESELKQALEQVQPDLVCLAGFMLLLSESLMAQFPQMINIHPSLLPKYPGLNAIKKAYESGDQMTGCTVHIVVPEMDAGPILVQESLEMREGESLEELEARMHQLEHQAYLKGIAAYFARV